VQILHMFTREKGKEGKEGGRGGKKTSKIISTHASSKTSPDGTHKNKSHRTGGGK